MTYREAMAQIHREMGLTAEQIKEKEAFAMSDCRDAIVVKAETFARAICESGLRALNLWKDSHE